VAGTSFAKALGVVKMANIRRKDANMVTALLTMVTLSQSLLSRSHITCPCKAMFSDHEHDSQPLLVSSNHNKTTDSTIFAVDDDEEDVDDIPLHSSRSTHSVRFTEQVQVIGAPLRSTLASREAGVCVPVTFPLSYGSKQYPFRV
jgi:hypothetical protein